MIKIIAIGKVKDKHLSALIDDYVKRICRYHKVEVIEVKDEPITDNEKAVLDKEGQRALAKIDDSDHVILLDLHGKSIDSLSLAKKIDTLFNTHSKIAFVIGGSLGLSEDLIKRADERIKLSDLTFLHQMTRLILLEQIYRSFKILNHETYHK
ncbi:MAG: 23S rRNA (pseudouridine(1915)-N(3))-methyltransferase RlmH [Erysipelotrichaceae bacterium]|nr:23S rRNA (pseudouridine(1915)-N(3))-methyltransferase RlmH [Erysipelotrichaceae bacterium]